MNTTLTVPVEDNLMELLEAFGEPDVIVPAALRQYLVDRCLQRIEQIEEKIAVYEQRYAMNYDVFNRQVTTDQDYLDRLNDERPLWESDAVEWAHRMEEAEVWRERLQKALQTLSLSLAPG